MRFKTKSSSNLNKNSYNTSLLYHFIRIAHALQTIDTQSRKQKMEWKDILNIKLLQNKVCKTEMFQDSQDTQKWESYRFLYHVNLWMFHILTSFIFSLCLDKTRKFLTSTKYCVCFYFVALTV